MTGKQTRLGLIVQIVVLAGLLLALVGAYQEIGALQRQNAQLVQVGAANHIETLAKINAILVNSDANATRLQTLAARQLANQDTILKAEQTSVRTQALFTAYVDPHGTYRQAIDTLLCTQERDLEAIATALHVTVAALPTTHTGAWVHVGACLIPVTP